MKARQRRSGTRGPSRGKFDLKHEDCVAGLAKIPAESVDLVVTSPPYNLGVKYRQYRDDQRREAHLEWCCRWGRELRRVLKPTGSLFLNVGGSPSNPLLPHQIALAFSDFLHLQNTLHWIKAITVEAEDGTTVSKGHYQPINSRRFVNGCHEYLFHFTRTGKVPIHRLAVGVPYTDKSNIARWGHTDGTDRRCRGNTWFVPYETIRDRGRQRPHPATFPVRLAEWCIRLHGGKLEESVMLDPFLGIGNSAVAARECGVGRFVGFEIDGEYLRAAKGRIESRK